MIKKYFDIKLLFLAIFSAIIQSIAITSFSIPAKLYPSGFSGISRLLSDIFHDYFSIDISYSVLYLVFNLIVSIIVYKKIGKKFTIYSVIQFSLVSLFSYLFPQLFILKEQLLYCLFGGIVNGIAVGLALSFNFSTGGFDFLSVYFSNKFKKSIWDYILYINVFILILAGIVYGWDRSLYSIIFQFCSTQIVKRMHQRYTYTTLTIITNKPDDVSNEILKNIRHGITEIKAEGYFSKKDTTMLYIVVNSYQYHDVVKYVLTIDPHAFINVQKTSEIYGNYYQNPLD